MNTLDGIKNLAATAVAVVFMVASSSFSEKPVVVGAAPLPDAANLVIGFVYFSVDAQSAGTHSFVEIYNPADEGVVLNAKYALHYKTGSSVWLKLDLEGTIPAKSSFLVNLGATTAEPVSFSQTNYKVGRLDLTGKFDQNFEAAYGQVKNSGTVVLTDNQNALASDKINNKDYLDLVGIGTSAICEGACLTGQTKDKGYARKKTAGNGYTDSDNNLQDFLAADFSKLNLNSLCVPRNSSDYPWTLTETFTCPDFVESFETLGLQPGSDATGVNFNWYSSDTVGNNASFVRILSSTDPTINATGKYGAAPLTTANRFYHRVSVTGLRQGAEYQYQVSNDGANWGPVYGYKTTPKGAFKFGAVSDAQIDAVPSSVQSWRTNVKSLNDAGVSFIVHMGDQVDSYSTLMTEYNDFFSPPELRSLPLAPVMGNHDSHCEFIYRYNLPNEQIWPAPCVGNAYHVMAGEGPNDGRFSAGNYYYLYNNVLFIGLNTAYYPTSKAETVPFINTYDEVIRAAKAAYSEKYDFIVVSHHKSTQTTANHVAEGQAYVEMGFEKLMTDHNVSLVFAGHDHISVRSKFLVWDDNIKKSVPNETTPYGYGNFQGDNTGTIYLTLGTASGMKYYAPFNSPNQSTVFPYLVDGTVGVNNFKLASATNKSKWLLGMERYEYTKQPEYTIVEVDGPVMKLKSYCKDGRLIDEFTITTDNIHKNQGVEPEFPPIEPLSATYEEGLMLADVSLPSGYKWENPETLIFAGDSQLFSALHTNPRYEQPSAGTIIVNVAKNTGFPADTIETTFAENLTLADIKNFLLENYSWAEPETTLIASAGVHEYKANYTNSNDSNYEQFSTGTITVNVARKSIVPPTANTGLVYTGGVLTGVNDGIGYTLEQNTAVNAGDYIAVAMPTANYQWSSGDNATSGRSIQWSIAKADPAVAWPSGLMAAIGKKLADVSLASCTNGEGPAGTFSWAYPNEPVGEEVGERSFSMVFTPEDSMNYNSDTGDVTVIIGFTTSVLSPGAVGPAVRPNEEATVIAPVSQLTAEFTAGPNPAERQFGIVNFYRQGKRVAACELRIYDAIGNFVNKVTINDNAIGSQSRRQVGSWNLKDAKGKLVVEGTYLLRGMVKTSDGKGEKVSLILGVR